jgi:CO/xanthine dehydrogenase FAD-binding subunit
VGGAAAGVSARYLRADTLDEALAALAGDPAARPVAGGTDLVVAARQGKRALPTALVGIHGIEALRGIAEAGEGLRIGALASHAEIVSHPEIRRRWTALADGSALVGSPATRFTGTLGGNVMNASPAMDAGGPLLVHDATAWLASADGERSVPVGELWLAPGRTSAKAGELLTRVTLPAPPPRSGSAYVRLEHRRAMEIAIVGVAARVSLAADGTVAECAIAITALAPTIRRVPGAEARLRGAPPTAGELGAAATLAAAAALPIDDVRAGAGYRRAMTAVVARRALQAAVARAGGGGPEIPATAHHAGEGGAW